MEVASLSLRSLPGLLLPSPCPLCGGGDGDAGGLCLHCSVRFLPHDRTRCAQCALPLADPRDIRCAACLRQPPAFDRSIAGFDYAAPLDRLVQALKYRGQLDLAALARQALLPRLRPEQLPALLCPVPLSARRLAERGYNQALEIARPLARGWKIPLVPRLLLRQRDTAPQALMKAEERQRNVRHAFVLMPREAALVANCHVGVVDDVMTTGATLQEIAALLKRHGATRVSNIVLARTPVHP